MLDPDSGEMLPPCFDPTFRVGHLTHDLIFVSCPGRAPLAPVPKCMKRPIFENREAGAPLSLQCAAATKSCGAS